MTAAFYAWCVIATDSGYEARELPYEKLDAPNVLAIHPDRNSADNAVNRAILMREQVDEQWRPQFDREQKVRAELPAGAIAERLASIEYETTLRNKLSASIREIAQPRA
ncbi:hypothetical protein [Sphingomonas colocasiae]|uniref:Uncharacterized protein n=1 Tax=Sphingomonas colocasiae TaxID=1848973 RepID=A0ABS7PXQ5_9SPHN|nr:hypothetical protein [Sphingomonas colocasiae]MBY8826133.1 hypothetical protein [Sphingomonas colocasiae]